MNYRDYEDMYADNENDRQPSRKGPSKAPANRAGFGRRRGKSPQQFNGIHRRRKKKIRW